MAYGHNIDQRKINKRNHIVDLFRQHQILSKAHARTLSGYSMDTIISIFNTLVKEQIVVPAEGKQKDKGRKAIFYSLNSDKWLYLGVTFNQTGIFSAIMSFSYNIKDKHTTQLKLGLGADEFVKIFIDHVKAILTKKRSYGESIIAIGCSIPGDIDLRTGILHSYTFMPFLKDLDFKSILTTHFPNVKIAIDHNIHSMTSYLLRDQELIHNYSRILFVSARSGTASGFIFNGSIVTGQGEFGHIKVSDEKKECICGRHGCLDIYFSYRSFIEILARNDEKTDPKSSENNELAGLDKLASFYRAGDKRIIGELDTRLYYFTNALLDIINATVPDLVILSGELFKVYGNPIEAIEKNITGHYRSTGYVTHYQTVKLSYRDMGTEIASIGICFEMIRNDWGYARG